ncbi:MAG: hypothetical protein M0Q93_00145 [Terrimicrobiaceae bacterium]|jgi:hypothetical protein|nr:hypothetical protein [Terrimicrobiaceae bacterium]
MRSDLLDPFAFVITFSYAGGVVALHFSPGILARESDRIAQHMANKLLKPSPFFKMLDATAFPTNQK